MLMCSSQIVCVFVVIMMLMVLRQSVPGGINNWPAEERIDFVLCLAGIPDCVAGGKGRL